MSYNKLNEETFGDAIKNMENVKTDGDDDKNERAKVFRALDDAVAANKDILEMDYDQGNYASVRLVGPGGAGKTSMVKKWCKERGYNLLRKSVTTMDESDFFGIPVPGEGETKYLPNGSFKGLLRPNSVLFIDEFNRARPSLRVLMFSLLNEHQMPWPGNEDLQDDNEFIFFPNLLLVVAAQNPADDTNNTDEPLDIPELTRFGTVFVNSDKLSFLSYLKEKLEEKENRSPELNEKNKKRYEIAKHILLNKDFEFDSGDDLRIARDKDHAAVVNRSFENALMVCDGTKKSFLKNWNIYSNPDKYDLVERILSNFSEKDDKANSVFKAPFKQVSPEWRKIEAALRNL